MSTGTDVKSIAKDTTVRRNVVVETFTNGLLDPEGEMLGPVQNGGHIIASTTPGCWGPMITPRLRGGHEVTQPVYVDGAQPGDSIAIRIQDITVTSLSTASGHDKWVEGHYVGDPYVIKKCPKCGTLSPETKVEGIGHTAVKCAECGTPVHPFQFVHGYTVIFDGARRVGLTVNKEVAETIARKAEYYAALPDNSVQHSILTFAPSDLVGAMVRLRPFLGQLGSTPAVRMPDSHNAGDFGSFLINAQHEYALTPEQLEKRTDGHMDIDAVRAGAILIVPVKVPGAGIYMGDMHALQGDGEIAGHTMDVSGTVTLQVDVLKGRTIEGPVLFPLIEDLPPLAKPFTEAEKLSIRRIASEWGVKDIEETAPISVIGTGPDLNTATEVGLKRAAKLLDMTVAEVRNRATITGAIEIGRHPGVIQVTFLAPLSKLEKAGLLPFASEMYGIG